MNVENERIKEVIQDKKLNNYEKMKSIMGLPECHPKIIIANEIMKVYEENLKKRDSGIYGSFTKDLTNYELFRLSKEHVYKKLKDNEV